MHTYVSVLPSKKEGKSSPEQCMSLRLIQEKQSDQDLQFAILSEPFDGISLLKKVTFLFKGIYNKLLSACKFRIFTVICL